MSTNRVAVVEARLDRMLEEASAAPVALAPNDPLRPGSTLSARRAVELFEDQVLSRALDVAARDLKREGRGYYTISSAGHENNAAMGAQLRSNDPCLLHYRSGALMMARQRQLGSATPLFDTLLSFLAAADDPVSKGRHKVWGSRAAWVLPQTSTIASHVPKAVGMAFALGRARRLSVSTGLPNDAIVVCSFGDASANHATCLSGINAARYASRRDNPTPILFLCEDNQIGISVKTPGRWIQDTFGNQSHLRFFEATGHIDETWDAVSLAVQTCRTSRSPVFLRMDCLRLWGHAGSDVETAYRNLSEVEAIEARDPLLLNARRLIETGAATPSTLQALVGETRERVAAAMPHALSRRGLVTASEVIAPLAPEAPEDWRAAGETPVNAQQRREVFGARLPETVTTPTRRTLGAHLNHALHDEFARDPRVIAFGEDVGKKGGVYGVTQRLQERFGAARCFDSLLDETTILGVAQGAAQVGFLPVPEISYLAYLHNAIDQLRGEACSTQFFSAGQFKNPMVVRIAGLAYQKGFGGHFHNDNSLGALREIPGLAIACPSRGDDAARLMRTAMAMASESGRVVVFLEPIALYHERDLYEAGDGAWLSDYPAPDGSAGSCLLPGEVGIHHEDADQMLIVSYANGFRLSLRAARRLEREHGIRARVLDLRWLAPLPSEAVLSHARACGRVLVADECRRTQAGIADAIIADLVESGFRGPIASVRAKDSYVPLGPAADLVLLSEDEIVEGALGVMACDV